MRQKFMQFVLISSFFVFAEKSYSQNVPVFSFEQLEPLLHRNSDSVYLINFWASWCVPCVKELPAIEQIAETYKAQKLSVLLVSLDLPNQLDTRLIPFLEKNSIKSKVILLNAPDFNSWIDKVSPEWSGALPGSLIYNSNLREFYEQSFSYDELNSIINPLINKQ